MGLKDGRKSFRIDLAVLIQYRSVTASLVAVAITLHAKASSLKTRFLEMKPTRIDQPPKVPWEPWAYLVPFPR